VPKGKYENGVFIVNEGNFSTPNGEISYYDRNTKSVTNKLYETVNNTSLLGDAIQSMIIHANKAYIVCSNSNPNKIEVVDGNTFQFIGTITGLSIPRYMAASTNRGYITEWVSFSSNGRVAVTDLGTNTVVKTIAVGNLPEQLLVANGKLFVTNSGDNTITIINLSTETVENTIAVGNNPGYITQDKNENLWVLSSDFTSQNSTLVSFNPATPTIQTSFNFSAPGASDLTINGTKDKLYYMFNNGIYDLPITNTMLKSTPLINRSFYGLGIDPKEGIIYGADAGGFTSNGKVVRFNPSTGLAIDSITVGIGPNSFIFR
jgi:YVTN family beta-propeller protein